MKVVDNVTFMMLVDLFVKDWTISNENSPTFIVKNQGLSSRGESLFSNLLYTYPCSTYFRRYTYGLNKIRSLLYIRLYTTNNF